ITLSLPLLLSHFLYTYIYGRSGSHFVRQRTCSEDFSLRRGLLDVLHNQYDQHGLGRWHDFCIVRGMFVVDVIPFGDQGRVQC
ncbi:hypothetical protein EDC04DRAFT_2842761, partial [Pisolithus marmoratus]